MNISQTNLIIIDHNPVSRNALASQLHAHFRVYQADSYIEAKNLLRNLNRHNNLALFPHHPPLAEEIDELVNISPQIQFFVPPHSFSKAQHNVHAIQTQHIVQQLQNIVPDSQFNETLGILGNSHPIQLLRQQIRQYAKLRFPILIEGESGSGKELIAHAIRTLSTTKEDKYHAVNCAALSANLLESTLFGHNKGAFTGAHQAHSGLFEDTQLLFLDEMGELPLELQAKLLRVLENGEYQRLGDNKTRHSQARIITATNRNLLAEVQKGRFRADLYHRLHVLTIKAPALRELREDKVLLLQYFRHHYAEQQPSFELHSEALSFWLNYDFPGNVRELRNIVIRLHSKYAGEIVTLPQLLAEIEYRNHPPQDGTPEDQFTDIKIKQQLSQGKFQLDQHLREQENDYIQTAIKLTAGNISKAAKLLGIKRSTLYSRLDMSFAL